MGSEAIPLMTTRVHPTVLLTKTFLGLKQLKGCNKNEKKKRTSDFTMTLDKQYSQETKCTTATESEATTFCY